MFRLAQDALQFLVCFCRCLGAVAASSEGRVQLAHLRAIFLRGFHGSDDSRAGCHCQARHSLQADAQRVERVVQLFGFLSCFLLLVGQVAHVLRGLPGVVAHIVQGGLGFLCCLLIFLELAGRVHDFSLESSNLLRGYFAFFELRLDLFLCFF